MKAVDVLGGIDGVEHLLRGVLAERRRQRRLHEDAVAGRVAIELPDERQHDVERASSPAAGEP